MADKAHDFFAAVLKQLGVPVTRPNIAWLEGQALVENTKARNNPLATTYTATELPSAPLPGNTAGVQEYANEAAGEYATAQTIKGFPAIVAALKSGNILNASFQNPPALVSAYTSWSGNTKDPKAGLAYFQEIKVRAQGGGANGLSAYSGFGFGDFTLPSPGQVASGVAGAVSGAVSDAATGWVKDLEKWIAPAALRGLLYVTFTGLAVALFVMALRRTESYQGVAGNARAARPGAGAIAKFSRMPEEIPF